MSPLITTITNSAANVLEASVMIVATVAAVAIKTTLPAPDKSTRGPITRHTMTDIGIEPGSITWMR